MAQAQQAGRRINGRDLRTRIDAWRRERRRRGPMPEELWTDAVALAREQTVYGASRTLGVDYGTLKGRVAEAQGHDAQRQQAAHVGFVELVPPLPAVPAMTGGTVIELSAADGARLTVRLPAGEGLDVAALVRAFQRGEP
jgi:hypothetical protein